MSVYNCTHVKQINVSKPTNSPQAGQEIREMKINENTPLSAVPTSSGADLSGVQPVSG